MKKSQQIKNTIQQKHCKGCLKSRCKNNRIITKTAQQKYKEGIKEYKESLKDFIDYRKISIKDLQKIKQNFYSIFHYLPKTLNAYKMQQIIKDYKSGKDIKDLKRLYNF